MKEYDSTYKFKLQNMTSIKRLNSFGIFTASVICLVLLFGVSNLVAQDNNSPTVTDFLFVIEQTPETVKLTCKKGCDWENLELSTLVAYQPQNIDQYGIRSQVMKDVENRQDLSDFYFELEISGNEMHLNGRKGTAWKTLTFSCMTNRCTQPIDEYGIVPQDSLKSE